MGVETRSRLRVIHAYLRLPHAVPVVAVLTTTTAFALLAAGGWPPIGTLANVLLSMLGSQIAIGVANELTDAKTDAIAKPSKPIPAGLVSPRGARILGSIALLGMVYFSASLGWPSFLLCTFGTGVGISYSLWFKRSLLAWLPYLVALPLIPIWTFVAVAAFDARLLMLFPLGALAGFAVYLAQSLPDVDADRATGVRNLTAVLGESRSIAIALAAFATTAAVAVIAAIMWIDSPAIVIVAAIAGVLIVTGDGWVYRSNRRLGVMACFPCVVAATAIVGLAWVVAVTR